MGRKRSARPPWVRSSEDDQGDAGESSEEMEVPDSPPAAAADPRNAAEESEASSEEEEEDEASVEEEEEGDGDAPAAGGRKADGRRAKPVPWLVDEEIRLLQVVGAYNREHGRVPRPPELKAALAGVVGRSVTLKQLEKKVGSLKQFYMRNARRGGLIRSSPRERRIYPLCQAVWGDANGAVPHSDKPANGAVPRSDKPANGAVPLRDKPADKPDAQRTQDKPAGGDGPPRRSSRLANGNAGRPDNTPDGSAQRNSDKPADGNAQSSDKPADGNAQSSDKPANGTARRSGKPANRSAHRSGEPVDGSARRRSDKAAKRSAHRSDKPADGTTGRSDKPADGTARPSDKQADGPVLKDYDKMCKEYPYLAEEVRAADRKQPGLFKRAFCILDSDNARTMNQQVKKARVELMKAERRRSRTSKKVTRNLLRQVQ